MEDFSAEDFDQFEDEAIDSSNNDVLARVVNACNEAVRLEAKKKELLASIKGIDAKYEHLKYTIIPDLMLEVGATQLAGDKFELEVKRQLFAYIPKASSKDPAMHVRRRQCHQWLQDNDFGRMIKRAISVELGKGSGEVAERIKSAIASEAPKLPIVENENIHASTWSAFLKECSKNGIDLPKELFNSAAKDVAIIKSR